MEIGGETNGKMGWKPMVTGGKPMVMNEKLVETSEK